MKKLWLLGLVFLLCVAQAMAAHIDHNVSAIHLETGTYTAGNVTSTWVYGDIGANNTYNWSGVASTPGYEVRFNFSDVTADRNSYDLQIYGYTSESGHIVGVEVYNFSGSVWVSLGTQEVAEGWAWANVTFYSQDFLAADVVWGRVVHLDRGNPGEDFMIDFISLEESDVVATEPERFVSGTCPIDDIQTTMLYIFIGIIILVFGIMAERSDVPGLALVAGLVTMVYSAPLYSCNLIYGLLLTFIGFIYIMWGLKWKWQ